MLTGETISRRYVLLVILSRHMLYNVFLIVFHDAVIFSYGGFHVKLLKFEMHISTAKRLQLPLSNCTVISR